MPAMTMIVVKAAFDEEAGVWFVEHSDLPGLNVEAASVEELREKLPAAILDLLEATHGDGGEDFDVPVELIAHASARVRSQVAA